LIQDPNKYPLALELLNKALQTSYYETHIPYWEFRGKVLDSLSLNEEAKACYSKAIELLKLRIKEINSQIEEAERKIGKMREEFRPERYGSEWAHIARLLWKLGKLNQAKEILADSTRVPQDWYMKTRKKFGLI
jgi:tetratricopeptide (TPR) repeat protein